jgi:endonuclease/exonuclease/phosphatase family metal-dependent hydrolase
MAPSDGSAVTASPASNLTRRRVLAAGAGLAAASGIATAATATQRTPLATPTVLTWNLYVGVDLSRLFEAESMADVRAIAGDFLAETDPAVYERRADGIAAEIAATGADVVAVQEALKLRTQSPGDFGDENADAASNVVVDMLDLVASKLSARGLEYRVAASAVTTDAELPADTDDGQVDVRITDRDALLVRDDVKTNGSETDTYVASIAISVPDSDRTIGLQRGYCLADLRLNGVDFTVVSTHLESISNLFRQLQAEELLATLPGEKPEILCGDFNSGPDTSSTTYDRLTESFDDSYATVHPDSEGFTCCQAARLKNETSRLNRRIDAVLFRGDLHPTASERVGHQAADRVAIDVDGESSNYWPSDHAGVATTFEIGQATPTPTPTSTPTPTATATQSPTPAETATNATQTRTETQTETASPTIGDSGPGLTVTGALAGIAGGILAWVRR